MKRGILLGPISVLGRPIVALEQKVEKGKPCVQVRKSQRSGLTAVQWMMQQLGV